MQHANFTAWAKACNLLDDKWYVYQYIRRLKTYHRQGQKCDEKTKKETKWQDSPRQDLIPDHGPQHGAVRCSTHWAAGNLSTSKAQYQTYVLGVLRTANIKPRKISAIPQKEKTRLCNILQSSQLVRSNFVHFDLLLLMFFFKKHLSSFIF